MQRTLIIAFSPIANDPRVMRQVRLLERRHAVTVIGYGSKPESNIEFVGLSFRRASLPTKLLWGVKLLLGRSDRYYWSRPEIQSAFAMLNGRSFDLVIANDIAALPLAIRIAASCPVLIDAHEYSPLEFEDKWLWSVLFGRYHDDLCRRYLPLAAVMVTVCKGIADEYSRRYGVAPEIVENAPHYQNLRPSPSDPERIRLVHHGAAIRSRHLETMIEVMRNLDDRFTLDFMLVGNDKAYLSELRTRAATDPRIRFLPPVPMPEICKMLNSYDMGVFLLPPVNFNYKHALPNKFFEFIQARLAIAIGPSPEMAKLVQNHDLGVVAASFEPADLAARLMRLTQSDIHRYKQAAHVAAASIHFEKSQQTLLRAIERALARKASAAALDARVS